MNNAGEGWVRGRGGMDGLTRINKRKEEIGFTLSPGNICADNQKNMVKDKFHAHSVKTTRSSALFYLYFTANISSSKCYGETSPCRLVKKNSGDVGYYR